MTTDLAILDEAVRHTVKISRIPGGITVLDYGATRREYRRLLAERAGRRLEEWAMRNWPKP